MIEDYKQRRDRLPSAVYELGLRLGAKPEFNGSSIHLKQKGRMKLLGAASWMSFNAIQTISMRQCAFDWRARAALFGMLSVRDTLGDGQVRLDARALGFIPLAHDENSLAAMRGSLMRYLVELAWAPDALLHNTELRWREDGPDRLAVSAGVGGTAVKVVLSLDTEGRIAGGFAPDRPRSAKGPFRTAPWRGRFSDYRHHDNMWLPFAGEVAWEIDGKEEVYWQGLIEHWEALVDER